MKKFANVAIVAYVVFTFILTVLLNKYLGTYSIEYQKSFGFWLLAVAPVATWWLVITDKKENV